MMYISDEEKQKFHFNSSMDTETLNFSELSSDTEGKSHCSYYSSSDSEFGDIDGTGSEDELVFTSQHLEITKKFAVTNKRKRNLPNSNPKRLRVYCNPLSKPLKEFTPVTCIGEIEFTGSNINEIFETARELPEFFAPSKDWDKRVIFKPELSKSSSSGIPRIDLYVYAIEASTENSVRLNRVIPTLRASSAPKGGTEPSQLIGPAQPLKAEPSPLNSTGQLSP